MNLSPHHPGHRTLVARTCHECGLLLDARHFGWAGSNRMKLYRCSSCRSREERAIPLVAERRRREREEERVLNQAMIVSASQRYQPWTTRDDERLLAARARGETTTEIARRLGRTRAGVKMRVKRIREGLVPIRTVWVISFPTATFKETA